jgi:RNA polymerase sigma-70 factor, ECF subfamily
LDLDDLTQLIEAMRPRLHRYCARMTGSAFEGEDVVQDALESAVAAFPRAGEIQRPESWLLHIAHNAALDALRSRKRRSTEPLDELHVEPVDHDAHADSRVVATANLATFMYLPVIQRSSVVLADVLGYSLSETATILGVSVPAVKAGLHRGRSRLRELVDAATAPLPPLDAVDRERVRLYADRFNARDFDALRDLLSEDVHLDLVNRTRLNGRKSVSVYFTRYEEAENCRLVPGWVEGRPALLASDPAIANAPVAYVILLGWADGCINAIRDFRYATYVMESLTPHIGSDRL